MITIAQIRTTGMHEGRKQAHPDVFGILVHCCDHNMHTWLSLSCSVLSITLMIDDATPGLNCTPLLQFEVLNGGASLPCTTRMALRSIAAYLPRLPAIHLCAVHACCLHSTLDVCHLVMMIV